MSTRKILLIAFKFPPFAGVGARRWAKFCKYLAEDGHEVHVITVKWRQNGPDTWIEDIANPKIIIHRIPSIGFHNIRYWRFNKLPLDRTLSRIRSLFLKILSPLYKVDEAQLWRISLLPFAKSIIKRENIVNVIATGAPFMANYWAAKIKETTPHINLIQDFRDQWTQDPAVPRWHNESVKRMEQLAKSLSDKNIYVTNELMRLMGDASHPEKEIVVHNGFDFEIEESNHRKRDFKFLYAGTTFVGREEPIEQLLSVLSTKTEKWPELKIVFVGSSITDSLRIKFNELFSKGTVNFLNPEDPGLIKERINDAFACLQFTARMYPDALSSKLFDYAVLRRPVLCLNYGGEIVQFIKAYNLGYSVSGDEPQAIEQAIDDLYSIWKRDHAYEIRPNGIEAFHCRNLVKKIEACLI